MPTAQQKVIAVEEHFMIPTDDDYTSLRPDWIARLNDMSELRLSEMDAAGIDMQLLSYTPSRIQRLSAAESVPFAKAINDFLAEQVARNPKRFAGLAALPTPDPAAAVEELKRAVTQLGFKGVMLYGLTNNRFIDERQFWPLFEVAHDLDVPIYLHPNSPHPVVKETYYGGYPALHGAGWAFEVEAGTQVLRLIMSGIFDLYPRLKIVMGHLGEGLPFSLWRCDSILSRKEHKLKRPFRDYFTDHIYVTTSGNFSQAALLCCVLELGIERILFAVDWPYASNTEAREFVDRATLPDRDKAKILGQNAATIFKI